MSNHLPLRFPWLALIQVGFAVIFFYRPWIALLYPSYQVFDDFMPVHNWALWALVNSLLIALPLPRWAYRNYLRAIGWLSFALFMLAAGAVFAFGIGANTGTWTYTVLAAWGLVLFGYRAGSILNHCRWFQKLKENPPSWFPEK